MSCSSSCFHISLHWRSLSQVRVSWFPEHSLVCEWNNKESAACEGLLYMHVHEIRLRVVVSVWSSAW